MGCGANMQQPAVCPHDRYFPAWATRERHPIGPEGCEIGKIIAATGSIGSYSISDRNYSRSTTSARCSMMPTAMACLAETVVGARRPISDWQTDRCHELFIRLSGTSFAQQAVALLGGDNR